MIQFGPAAAPRWFEQRLDRLDAYLDHLVAHGASSIEFIVHGGLPGLETERVHLSQPFWRPAIAAAQSRGLDVHLHAPLTPDYRLGGWNFDRDALLARFGPITDLLVDIDRNQARPPVLVLHAANVDEGSHLNGEQVTSAFLSSLALVLRSHQTDARIAIESRLRTEPGDVRFDRRLSSLASFIGDLELSNVGICWDVANHLGSATGERLPTPEVLGRVDHVHLHDRHLGSGGFHAPLRDDGLPWRQAIRHLRTAGWSGTVTLEIRYRYALEQGDPWRVLGDSLDRARTALIEE